MRSGLILTNGTFCLYCQGSFDSGQGSIEVDPDPQIINSTLQSINNTPASDQLISYQFEIRQVST